MMGGEEGGYAVLSIIGRRPSTKIVWRSGELHQHCSTEERKPGNE